jgi:hypothetical protein
MTVSTSVTCAAAAGSNVATVEVLISEKIDGPKKPER